MSRLEIIEEGLNLNEIRVQRFISTFCLSKEEIELFKEKFSKCNYILDVSAYYQEGNKNIYKKNKKNY